MTLPAGNYSRNAVLYADGGFRPLFKEGRLKIGPEQLVVIGLNEYADEKYNLGVDESIQIPLSIDKLVTTFKETGKNTIETQILPPPGKSLRILFQQFGADGLPHRTWGGAPPEGKKMNELLTIQCSQGKKSLSQLLEYDKMIWSGLSWAAVEIKPAGMDPGRPVTIRCYSAETEKLELQANVYALTY
jgi:hypothetical protein